MNNDQARVMEQEEFNLDDAYLKVVFNFEKRPPLIFDVSFNDYGSDAFGKIDLREDTSKDDRIDFVLNLLNNNADTFSTENTSFIPQSSKEFLRSVEIAYLMDSEQLQFIEVNCCESSFDYKISKEDFILSLPRIDYIQELNDKRNRQPIFQRVWGLFKL